ncbi:MAG: ATP-binding protein [bacterium]|uniref:MinD superfamily P-loop ATPase n=2 Tax=Bacteria candidate phyla TaxID=1783234 RepID=A0A101I2M9_UNCT6|nr:MAG: MinD superfamily P-loop ATPase [candidate division TA06 bacterium 32_111]KUK87618.1 MAG: MinD superfamily P-loop ATPase [candidate division TA06 bacterium 34_109]MDI6699752.1 ATP-binding protein [bacterium]HAF07456.1 (4Fe-4S)-binding protein [candidate division WOR-3 bacterium]HCP17525.1 (4Fe-4S)-binding protein [candidate division WOR-3 bacterium]
MKELVIVSGKGGTGKTTITASFSVLADKVIVADCDVDAPDLHLLLHPELIKKSEFKGSKAALIDKIKCVECNLCRENCRFDAVSDDFIVEPHSCEGCGVCALICPVKAIEMKQKVSGNIYLSKIENGFMSHAMLDPGEENSGKLVTFVRDQAKEVAASKKVEKIIIDGAPGISCPVISSITGTSAGVIVTEPTVSGVHDLKRILELMEHFRIKPFILINKFDINIDKTKEIEDFCHLKNYEVVGKIPFDPSVTNAMVNGEPVVKFVPDSKVSKEIKRVWEKVSKIF